VAHSLMEAGALAGMDVVVAGPPGYQPAAEVFAGAVESADATGGSVEVGTDARAAATGAQAIYTDVWVSMGDEAEGAERFARLRDYQVTEDLMKLAAPDAVFMHCLPAHRGEEVAAEVIDGPTSIVFEQAANRLPTEQAVIHALISGAWGA
jgi:ornithine carbamoyltransferase